MPSSLHRFVRYYNRNFDKRPIPTLIVTNGILSTVADVLTAKPPPGTPGPSYDFERTLRFSVYGMAMGPIIGRWLRLLERQLPVRQGTKGNGLQFAKRVFADQAIMAPIGLILFVGSMGLMEGRDLTGVGDKFQEMYWPALMANWKVWPLLQTINFTAVPLPYRVPFQSTCGIAWTLYLSLLNVK
ncbi:hypothetical protein TREMEDRAFT_67721 [Tremella mesenterica DSM 1558]|uniref:uncharacterized protein n=1 Tax=Tremella mesenterica (strain ATCC 24925 / CBS 8224 / DSM 1558 / NBRC 9311 / NRRL Y-6157 / RJB 2259-6 / UBC 559-6) TaxID=578456 RepID=UPI0003F49718|nr:uncharacterized protein TREMEDRAFT_67721 [Tremella mesenterica DSM 1558]EIW71354.1 hypothetical protein TREMEDRAFT_67721 [Tremella mesenterica DSM 1558]